MNTGRKCNALLSVGAEIYGLGILSDTSKDDFLCRGKPSSRSDLIKMNKLKSCVG